MPHFDDLRAQPELPVSSGSEVNELRWNLRRQAKRIRRGGAMRDHGFRTCRRKVLDHFFGSGRPRPKTRFDGPHLDAPVN